MTMPMVYLMSTPNPALTYVAVSDFLLY